MCYNGTIARAIVQLKNKLKIYVEQDIFMHVLAGALPVKRIGNRLEIWIEYVCFSLNCIALVGTIYISYLNGYFGYGRHLGEHSTFSYQSRPILKLNVFRCFTNGRFNISDLILSNYFCTVISGTFGNNQDVN